VLAQVGEHGVDVAQFSMRGEVLEQRPVGGDWVRG
jgi:hypothetical protein